MENTNSANIEKADHTKRSIYINFEADDSFLSLVSDLQLKICTQEETANLKVFKEDQFYLIDIKSNQIKINSHNIRNSLNIIASILKNEISVSSSNFTKPSKSHKLNHSFFNLSNIASKSKDLIEFCLNLSNIELISHYSLLNLIIQGKGEAFSTSMEFNKGNVKNKIIEIHAFNKLFSAIKKSKNGSFGQSSLKSNDFEILGTCLAKEFSLDQHNIILILSNNDFLPQQEHNITAFNELCKSIAFYFNFFLKIQFLKEQTHYNQKMIVLSDSIGEIRDESFNMFDVKHKERITLLGELLNTLRHELSNPLFGLQLSAELIPLEDLDEDSKELAVEIQSAIKRCQDIMANFSELYTDKSTQQETDLIKLIKEVLILTKSKTKSIQRNIMLNAKPILNDQVVLINTNKTLLAQVIFNLIINSSQALETTKVPHQIEIDIRTDSPQFVSILLSDNGPGIPQEDINNIFSPFYTTKEDGTGLGLSICRDILHKLNGSIKNLPSDKGAKFLIELPYENFSS